jgi:uncharacterized protein YndB with AHSA1/START domain/catechol 2,3-dioxygenase-like lactoylglutathione lyase family enzyme
MARSTFVYVTYIRTTPEKLWSALTEDEEFMKQYWFGTHCESQWTAGSSWKHVSPDGQLLDDGEIVEADPPRRLVIRWRNQNKPELAAEGDSLCTMELEPSGGAVKLSITHTIEREGSKVIVGVSGGWPKVLSNLKSLLESGAIALQAPYPLRSPSLERSHTMAKVIFGNHFSVVVPRSDRESVCKFYCEVLGGEVTKADPDRDFIRLGEDFYIVLYGDVPDESEFLRSGRSVFLELKSDNVEEMRRKIVASGLARTLELPDPHLYFQAPGGQCLRLVGIDEDLSFYEGAAAEGPNVAKVREALERTSS